MPRSIESVLEWAEQLKIRKLEELISGLEEILEEKRGDEFRDNFQPKYMNDAYEQYNVALKGLLVALQGLNEDAARRLRIMQKEHESKTAELLGLHMGFYDCLSNSSRSQKYPIK